MISGLDSLNDESMFYYSVNLVAKSPIGCIMYEMACSFLNVCFEFDNAFSSTFVFVTPPVLQTLIIVLRYI